jgi:hypothetical protein
MQSLLSKGRRKNEGEKCHITTCMAKRVPYPHGSGTDDDHLPSLGNGKPLGLFTPPLKPNNEYHR